MSTYSTNLALTLIGTGEEAGTWGTTTNTNLGTLLEQAISGYVTQSVTDSSSPTVLTIPNGASGVARNMYIELTGALTANRTVEVPANKKLYYFYNNTTGGYSVTVKVSGQTGIVIPNGMKYEMVCNGTDVYAAANNQVQGAYPVGSIYMNAGVATNPATLLGFGTWSALGEGRVLMGAGTGGGGTYTAGATGGSKDATLVSHTHTVTDPGHFHYTGYDSYNVNVGPVTSLRQYTVGTNTATSTATTGISIDSAGSSGTDANLQPYLVVYMWQRTA